MVFCLMGDRLYEAFLLDVGWKLYLLHVILHRIALNLT